MGKTLIGADVTLKPYPNVVPWHVAWGGKPLRDDDVRSDLRMLHAEAIGFLRTAMLDGVSHVGEGMDGNPVFELPRQSQIDLAIRFLKEVPCPAPE